MKKSAFIGVFMHIKSIKNRGLTAFFEVSKIRKFLESITFKRGESF